jgi:type IV secretory pathway VirB10-like protein
MKKAKSVTSYDLAKRFNIRMSIARRILKDKENEGVIVPYIHESGFVVYTTPSEIEKRDGGKPIMIVDVLEEIASSMPKRPVITKELDVAPSAVSAAESAKPGKRARQRRALDDRKVKEKARQPEIVVEPLAETAESLTAEVPKLEEKKPKKKVTKKKAEALRRRRKQSPRRRSLRRRRKQNPRRRSLRRRRKQSPRRRSLRRRRKQNPRRRRKQSQRRRSLKNSTSYFLLTPHNTSTQLVRLPISQLDPNRDQAQILAQTA